MWILKWGQPGLTKKLHDLMAPRGKFKYSSALQLASYSTAWHEFIHKHLNPGWVWLWGVLQWANMTCQQRRVHLLMHIFAYNQTFHSREIMGVGCGDRAVYVTVGWGAVPCTATRWRDNPWVLKASHPKTFNLWAFWTLKVFHEHS